MRDNLCADNQYSTENDGEDVQLLAEAMFAKSFRLESGLAAGAAEAMLGCGQPYEANFLVQCNNGAITPLADSMVWLQSVSKMLVLRLVVYTGIMLNL